MNFIEKFKRMEPKEIANRPEVRALWNKSLFWSLAHRRSFKYPLGTERVKNDFFDYKPSKEPVPLTEVETALLCWAGARYLRSSWTIPYSTPAELYDQ